MHLAPVPPQRRALLGRYEKAAQLRAAQHAQDKQRAVAAQVATARQDGFEKGQLVFKRSLRTDEIEMIEQTQLTWIAEAIALGWYSKALYHHDTRAALMEQSRKFLAPAEMTEFWKNLTAPLDVWRKRAHANGYEVTYHGTNYGDGTVTVNIEFPPVKRTYHGPAGKRLGQDQLKAIT